MEKLPDSVWRALEYVETFGLMIRRGAQENVYSAPEHIPFTTEPSFLSLETFQKIKSVQPIINRLIHRASQDHHFVQSTLSNVVENDEFWQKLLNVYETARNEGKNSPFKLGLHRVDYLVELEKTGAQRPLMVEMNTIASSMGGHAVGIGQMHQALSSGKSEIPENNVVSSLAAGIVQAIQAYSEHYSVSLQDLCFVTLREDGGSVNFSDQKRVEFEVQKVLNFQVASHRATLSDFAKIKNENDGRIFYKEKEVAVFYLRTGYDPSCYRADSCWDARLEIEKSRAIKSPCAEYHLLTNKVFQAKFTNKEVLNKFLTKDEITKLSETFCDMVELVNWKNPQIKKARDNPQDFCLKILREGGADGNLFREEILPVLSKMETDTELRTKYCLMKLIKPEESENTIVRSGKVIQGRTISEYGIFGIYLSDIRNNTEIINSNDGHLVRTKPAESDKGGVAVGAAAISSIGIKKS